jgi:hypothetical protein
MGIDGLESNRQGGRERGKQSRKGGSYGRKSILKEREGVNEERRTVGG